jgi:uncharacterized protein DUF1761
MDALSAINYWAVLAAAVSAFVVGGLWYSPLLFGNAWLKETGLRKEQLDAGNPAVTFGVSFVLAALASFVFAMFLGPKPAFGFALAAGVMAGLCWVATSFGISYLFERRSFRLFLINGGYHTVQYALIGAVLGLWH